MRAHIPVNRKTRDELEAIGQRAVERERQDIATRCLYIVLLACWQIGLAPREPCAELRVPSRWSLRSSPLTARSSWRTSGPKRCWTTQG